MIDGDRLDAEMTHFNVFAGADGDVLHDARFVVAKFGEAGVNLPIENVAFKEFDYFCGRVNAHRLFERGEQASINNGRVAIMIHVRVRHDDVTHVRRCASVRASAITAGVNGDAVINDVAA